MKKQLLVALFIVSTILVSRAQEAGGDDMATIDPQAMLMDSVSSIKATFGLTQIGGEN